MQQQTPSETLIKLVHDMNSGLSSLANALDLLKNDADLPADFKAKALSLAADKAKTLIAAWAQIKERLPR